MPLRFHLDVLRSSIWLIVLSVAVAASVAVVVSMQLPRTYESRATLYVGQTLGDPQLDYSGLLASQILTQTYAELVTTRPVLLAVIADLDLEMTATDLKKKVSTEIPLEGTLLEIAVRDRDPELAASIANAIAQQLVAQAPQEDPSVAEDLQRRLDNLDATINRLEAEVSALLARPTRTAAQEERLAVVEEQLATFSATRSTLIEDMSHGSPNALTVVEDAIASDDPVAPSRSMIVGLAAAASLAGSVLLAYIRNARSRAVDDSAVEHRARGGSVRSAPVEGPPA